MPLQKETHMMNTHIPTDYAGMEASWRVICQFEANGSPSIPTFSIGNMPKMKIFFLV
jgi:hypothetical protein